MSACASCLATDASCMARMRGSAGVSNLRAMRLPLTTLRTSQSSDFPGRSMAGMLMWNEMYWVSGFTIALSK